MKTNPDKDLMVTPEALGVCGSISYWRASGSVLIADMQKAWDAAGLDMAMFRKAPEPETALRRAVLDLATRTQVSETVEIRKLVRPCKEAHTWAIVLEIAAKDSPPAYSTLAIVWFENGQPNFKAVDGNSADVEALRTTVGQAFSAQQGLFASEDITGWLVKLAYANGAVTLRDSGGVYFIPRPAMEFWNKAADAIQTASGKNHQIFRIPAMRNAEAIEAITEAVTAEAEQEAQKINDEVMAGLGERALETRKDRIAALLTKVGSYEELVGQKMKISERLESLQAAVATAKLIGSAPVEEAVA